jgi:hypothetical protein
MREKESVVSAPFQLAVVREQWFQSLVDIRRIEGKSNVERCQRSEIPTTSSVPQVSPKNLGTHALEVLVVQILKHNSPLRCQLQQLEDQTQKRGGFLLSVCSADEGQLDRSIA